MYKTIECSILFIQKCLELLLYFNNIAKYDLHIYPNFTTCQTFILRRWTHPPRLQYVIYIIYFATYLMYILIFLHVLQLFFATCSIFPLLQMSDLFTLQHVWCLNLATSLDFVFCHMFDIPTSLIVWLFHFTACLKS